MLLSSALSKVFAKMKGAPSIDARDISTYLIDIFDEPLLIRMIVMIVIIMTYLMRPRSKQKHMNTTSGDEIQTLNT